jgi:hypothetical protein
MSPLPDRLLLQLFRTERDRPHRPVPDAATDAVERPREETLLQTLCRLAAECA